MASDYLVLEHVTKEFVTPERRSVRAVDAVNLAIAQGQFVTLLGPSGCGKTTTLRMIAGFEFPTRGQIMLEGRDIAATPPNQREMAMVFQSYALFPHLSVFENIAYGVRLQRHSGREVERIVGEMTTLVNLTGMEKRRPSELSGGQQQRVALARAIAIRPKVLLFDEPLSNLDAKLRVSLRAEIRQLQKRLGITSVYVTHDQSEAMSLSDTIVVMHAGRIEQAGAPSDIYLHPANRFVADFIGRANFSPVRVMANEAGLAQVDVMGLPVRVPSAPAAAAGSAATLMVRPEGARLTLAGAGLPVRVKAATYYGSNVEYEVDLLGQNWIVVDAEQAEVFHEGDEARLRILPDKAYVLAEQ